MDDDYNQWGDHSVSYKNVESVYYIPETNITNISPYTNYTLKNK